MGGSTASAGSAGTTRGGAAKGDARRDLIVRVATEIFGTQGFRAATMLQIAAACGISRTGLLHHFATKESLLEAVLARRDADGADERTGELTKNTGDGRLALRRLLRVVERNAT